MYGKTNRGIKMNRYYKGTKLFEWLRKTVFKIEKPFALGWGEWEKWDDKLRAERPVAFFFTEVLPDWIELVPRTLLDPVYNVKYYINNRWVTVTHGLTSTLKRGEWHDLETRLLYSMFDSYIDHVEIDEAWGHIAWSDADDRKKYNTPFWASGWLRWRTWRCPEAAMDHLKWEQTLVWEEGQVKKDSKLLNKRTDQALAADEKIALYVWWKEIRPLRGEPWDVSGFRAFWDRMDAKYGKMADWLLSNKPVMTKAERKEYDRLSKVNNKLELSWEKEDEEMMIRLIRVRNKLWT